MFVRFVCTVISITIVPIDSVCERACLKTLCAIFVASNFNRVPMRAINLFYSALLEELIMGFVIKL